MSAKDAVIPFVFEALPVRGALVQLENTWQRMQRDHDYPDPVTQVLGDSAAATALIAQSLKFDGTITFQINGGGPLSMLVMQATDDLELFVFVRHRQRSHLQKSEFRSLAFSGREIDGEFDLDGRAGPFGAERE